MHNAMMTIRVKREHLGSWPNLSKVLIDPATGKSYPPQVENGLPNYTLPIAFGKRLLEVEPVIFEAISGKGQAPSKPREKEDAGDIPPTPSPRTYRKRRVASQGKK